MNEQMNEQTNTTTATAARARRRQPSAPTRCGVHAAAVPTRARTDETRHDERRGTVSPR